MSLSIIIVSALSIDKQSINITDFSIRLKKTITSLYMNALRIYVGEAFFSTNSPQQRFTRFISNDLRTYCFSLSLSLSLSLALSLALSAFPFVVPVVRVHQYFEKKKKNSRNTRSNVRILSKIIDWKYRNRNERVKYEK